MIPVRSLVYEMRMRLNKKVSNEYQDIPDMDLMVALNEAQNKLIKKKLGQNNNYSLGLDSFKKRYEDLQSLVVPFEQISVTKTQELFTSYSSDITKLQYDYFVPLNMYATCTKGKCKNRVIYIGRIVRHADLTTLLNNSNFTPSFAYQETLAVISGNNVIVYANDPDGDFIVNNLYISYLRYPQKIDIAGYFDLQGNPSVDSDCELVDYLKDELLDIATRELAMDTENTPVIQYSEIRNKNNE